MWIKTYGAYYIPKGTTAPASLCWNCGKATGGSDCPWANRFEPVEGWTATPTIIKADRNASFMVHQCPLYKEG